MFILVIIGCSSKNDDSINDTDIVLPSGTTIAVEELEALATFAELESQRTPTPLTNDVFDFIRQNTTTGFIELDDLYVLQRHTLTEEQFAILETDLINNRERHYATSAIIVATIPSYEDSVQNLLHLSQHRDANVRGFALYTLASMQDNIRNVNIPYYCTVFQTLVENLRDESYGPFGSSTISYNALEYFYRFRNLEECVSEEIVELLFELASTDNNNIRGRALLVFGYIGTKDMPHVCQVRDLLITHLEDDAMFTYYDGQHKNTTIKEAISELLKYEFPITVDCKS